MAYRAEFTISRIGESVISPADRASLLMEVRDYLVGGIQKDDSRVDVESYVADDLAYANIDAELYFKDRLLRLSVRLYSNEDELRAEVFFSATLQDEVSSKSTPMFIRAPLFMPELVKRYDCRVGPHQLGIAASEEDELAALLFDPERKIPVLMVSRDAGGSLPYRGIDSLSGQLLGMAQVVEAPPQGRYRREWGYQFDIRDGAARIIWPRARPHFLGDGRGGFYMPGIQNFISEVIDDLEDNASPESFDREFVAVNIACMRFRNEQLQSRAQADESKELKQSQRRTRKAEREIERLERDLAAERAERIRAENLLDTSLRDVERLNEELENASRAAGMAEEREENRELRREKDALADILAKRDQTINKMNDVLQLYRQKERIVGNRRNGSDSLIGDPTKNPGQLSLVGHGLNIMRDPVRRFIIKRLSGTYNGNEDVELALDRISADTKGARNLESTLDFSNFHLAVSDNLKCFGQDARKMSNALDRIRTNRNRTIHPGFGENTAAQRSEALLNDISIVLEMIGAYEESQRVTELKNAL